MACWSSVTFLQIFRQNYYQELFGFINQIKLMNVKTNDPGKQNKKNVQHFTHMKKTSRHHSYKKTDPFAKTYYFSTNKRQEDDDISQQGPIFRSAYAHTVDVSSKKSSKEAINIKKKKIDQSVQQIYNLRKNAYKNYIQEIYLKINDELKKKNSYFNIVTHANIQPPSYTEALVTKPAFKPEEADEIDVRKKLKEKLKLEKLQEQTSSLEKIKNKLFIIKKASEKKVELKVVQDDNEMKRKKKTQIKTFCNDMSLNNFQERHTLKVTGVRQKPAFKQKQPIPNITQKRKDKIFSLNITVNSKKVNMEEYTPTTKIFNKKDPFVCGLHVEKQSTQQKNRQKILFFIDFLWKVNYSNGLFIKSAPEQVCYKAYVGGGNNSFMIKSILKRRFWWTISDKQQGCNFVWTQLKQNSIFREQQPSKTKKDSIYNFNVELFKKKLAERTVSKTQNDQAPQLKIFNSIDNAIWLQHSSKNTKTQFPITERTYQKRSSLLIKKNIITIQNTPKLIMHNHLEQNYFIGNKKALFYFMRKYYSITGNNVFSDIPLTFHLIKGVDDPEYKNFLLCHGRFESLKKKNGSDEKNMWIVKPGEYSNRGKGISVCYSLDDIHIRIKGRQKSNDGSYRSFIIQKYIQKPLLYKYRKFDIRHYLLLTCFNGTIKAYWYPQGYIRTSSSLFTLKRNGNLFVHLTNEAIQKNSEEYSKYEKGNKISYDKFQNYLDKQVKDKTKKNIFFDKILPQMKEITKNAVKSTYLSLDQKRKEHNFQLLGMDFMIDQNYQPWLIQINTNPCLQLSCPLLAKLIPSIIQNTFKICIDPFFPPPEQWTTNKKNFLPDNSIEQNKFQLIFDESVEGQELEMLFRGDYKIESNIGKVEQDAEIYENDGEEQWQAQNPKKQ